MNNNEIYKLVVCIIAFLFIFSGTGFAGTTRITPDKSIQDAIYKSQPGDIIEIQSGTYFENVVVTKPLVIRGEDTGSGLPIIDAKGKGSAIILQADGVSLEDLNFQGASGWDEAGIVMKSNGCTVLNCTASNNLAIGIYLVGCSNNILINNQAFNCNFGIALNLSSNNTFLSSTQPITILVFPISIASIIPFSFFLNFNSAIIILHSDYMQLFFIKTAALHCIYIINYITIA